MSGMIFSVLLVIFIAPGLTCLFEVPVVRKMKVTANTRYIISVNILTNLILNTGSLIISNFFGHSGYIFWVILSEAVTIPLSEALLYSLVSDLKPSGIVCISYLANMISFFSGMICTFILKEIFL